MNVIYDFLRTLILPFVEIDQAVPRHGKIFDLGCGEGTVTRYLARIKTRTVIGVDNNKKRLRNSKAKNLKFILADIRNYSPSGADAIIISDVLHHLNYEDQKELLNKIASHFKKGGFLIIKEIDTKEFIRSSLSRFWDFVFYPSDEIYYHNSKDLTKKLGTLGFKVDFKRVSRLFPGSTNLFICQKN